MSAFRVQWKINTLYASKYVFSLKIHISAIMTWNGEINVHGLLYIYHAQEYIFHNGNNSTHIS